MSHDLVFWRQEDGDERPPLEIYRAFAEGEVVEGVPELPVEEFLAKLIEAFPKARREANGSGEWIHWVSRNKRAGFEVEWTGQYVWVTLRPLDHGRANRMLDIANSVGCALYDPQIDERFVQP